MTSGILVFNMSNYNNMRKIISLFVAVYFLTNLNLANGYFYIQGFNLKITKNAIGGEGVFNFAAYGKTDIGFSLQPNFETQITTLNSNGISEIPFLSLNVYRLYESEQSGWNLTSVVCSSINPSVVFTYIPNGVEMSNISDLDSIICNFTNTKQSAQKIPVLIVPGIMGTEIFKGDNKLWPNSSEMARPNSSDVFMDPLSYKDDGSPLDASLETGQVVSKEFTFNYTKNLVSDFINDQGYTEGKDLFTFPYDWRKDIQEIANENLKGQIDYILTQTEAGIAAGR